MFFPVRFWRLRSFCFYITGCFPFCLVKFFPLVQSFLFVKCSFKIRIITTFLHIYLPVLVLLFFVRRRFDKNICGDTYCGNCLSYQFLYFADIIYFSRVTKSNSYTELVSTASPAYPVNIILNYNRRASKFISIRLASLTSMPREATSAATNILTSSFLSAVYSIYPGVLPLICM